MSWPKDDSTMKNAWRTAIRLPALEVPPGTARFAGDDERISRAPLPLQLFTEQALLARFVRLRSENARSGRSSSRPQRAACAQASSAMTRRTWLTISNGASHAQKSSAPTASSSRSSRAWSASSRTIGSKQRCRSTFAALLFQQRVWKALRDIPPGATASYTDVAGSIGAPNALAVPIPCHRVVRTDGNVSGDRWGVERKRALLAREARS